MHWIRTALHPCRYWKFLADFITFTSQQAAANTNSQGTSQTTINGQVVLNCLRGTQRSNGTSGSYVDPLANLGASAAPRSSHLTLPVALAAVGALGLTAGLFMVC